MNNRRMLPFSGYPNTFQTISDNLSYSVTSRNVFFSVQWEPCECLDVTGGHKNKTNDKKFLHI